MEDKVAFYRLRKGEGDDVLDGEREMVQTFCDINQFEILDEFVSREKSPIADMRQLELKDAISICKEHGVGMVTPKINKFMQKMAILNPLVSGKVDLIALDMDMGDRPNRRRRLLKILMEQVVLRYEGHSQKTKNGMRKSEKVLGRPKSFYRERAALGGKMKAKPDLDYSKSVFCRLKEGLPDFEDKTLEEISKWLEDNNILTRSGKTKWALSSVRNLKGRWINDKR